MDQSKVRIEKATTDDLYKVQAIARKTFFDTFSVMNAKEDMDIYLRENLGAEQLLTELNNPDSEFYTAELENDTVGYLKINFFQAQTEIKTDEAMEIERIYTLHEYQGKGIGQILFDRALAIAKSRNIHYIWLGVWGQNTKAIRFYEKNGFVPFGEHIFVFGNDRQVDILMKLRLK